MLIKGLFDLSFMVHGSLVTNFTVITGTCISVLQIRRGNRDNLAIFLHKTYFMTHH